MAPSNPPPVGNPAGGPPAPPPLGPHSFGRPLARDPARAAATLAADPPRLAHPHSPDVPPPAAPIEPEALALAEPAEARRLIAALTPTQRMAQAVTQAAWLASFGYDDVSYEELLAAYEADAERAAA